MRARVAVAALLVALVTPAAAAASLQSTLEHALRVPHVSLAATGAVVLDLDTGATIYSRNASLALLPASNEKLAVTYAALTALGPGFTIETDVLGEGQQAGTTWQGDLALKGYGDPTLSDADLTALAHTPVALVSAGVKSILDVAATLERLETLSVGLVGYRSAKFPGFYIQDSGYAVPWVAQSAVEVADMIAARDALGLEQALVVANPIPDGKEMARDLHDATLDAALKSLQDNKITGKDVTPFLLAFFHEHTDGVSLQANIDLVVNNARLAGGIAMAMPPA